MFRIERHERLTGRRSVFLQTVVEHLLPGRCMTPCRVGNDTVHIEQHSVVIG